MVLDGIAHVGALGASTIGAFCVAGDRSRTRVWDLMLTAPMVLAMIDGTTGLHLLPVAWWLALTVLATLVVGMWRLGTAAHPAERATHAIDGIGGIVMTTLMLFMSAGHSAAFGGGHSGHGVSAAAFGTLLIACSVGIASACVWMAWRMPPASPRRMIVQRTPPLAMAVSVLLMASGVLI